MCDTFTTLRRELCVGAAALERIRLVAKLGVSRSGPEAARFAYRWQSAWEIRCRIIPHRRGRMAVVLE
jgi:hypothetical protein